MNGGLEAAEALGLATVNVFSFAMMSAGVVALGFDVADLEDLREGVRKGLGFDVYGGERDGAVEKEMEEWIRELLEKNKGKELGIEGLKEGVLGKLAEMGEKERVEREGGTLVGLVEQRRAKESQR